MKTEPDKRQAGAVYRVGLLVLIVLLGALVWRSAELGWGSLLTSYAARTDQIAAAEAAVKIIPGSADAHYVRATILEASDRRAAVVEHSNAIRSRPDDYALWLSLARANELNGEAEKGIAAARHAIILAPFYSQPRYQLGNLLLRTGSMGDAFVELRQAAESDPSLLPGIIDLAWRMSGRNAEFVTEAIAPRTNEARIVLATFFRMQDQIDPAIDLYQAAGKDGADHRAYYVGRLISANRFKEAARLWSTDHPEGVGAGQIRDAGFEKESDLKEAGFSWRVGEKTDGLQFTLDTTQRMEGSSSLRINFTGGHDPASPIISQLIMVEPGARYELKFMVRTDNLLSGGMPRIFVLDATSRAPLNQTPDFDRTSNGWREYVLQFEATADIENVQIVLQRQPCATSPCPIFGQLWLDGFSLRKL